MGGPPRKPYKVVYEAVMEKKKELVIYVCVPPGKVSSALR